MIVALHIAATAVVISAGFASVILGGELDKRFNKYSDRESDLLASMAVGMFGVVISILATVAIWTTAPITSIIAAGAAGIGYGLYRQLRWENTHPQASAEQ